MSAKQHIVVITTSFRHERPGREAAGSFVEDFVEALAEHRKVTVIAPRIGRNESSERTNLAVRYFDAPTLTLSYLISPNPLHLLQILKILRSGQQTINQLIREAKVDHILALWVLPSGYWARNAWMKHGIPYSTWALGSDIWSLGRVPFVRGVLSKVLKDSRSCFADGYLLKNDVENISGRSCDFLASTRKLHIESEKSMSDAPPYKLAFLGRWHKNKGVDLLMDSLELLDDNDWKKIEEVRICGGGPLEEIVNAVCDSLKKEGRPVELLSYLSKDEAADLLTWADYLLLPSSIESIPLVFSDAMQVGCPVIATPVGDLPRLIKEYEPGIIAADFSPQSFADVVKSALAASPAQFRKGVEEAAKDFSMDETVNRFLIHLNHNSW